MAISLNNSVVNIQGTPGFITDLFINQPSAPAVAVGTIFVASDTGIIYQSNGITWFVIGGGGGTQDLQSVCNVGNTLLNTAIISTDGAGAQNSINSNSIQMLDGLGLSNLAEPMGNTISNLNSGTNTFTTDSAINITDTGNLWNTQLRQKVLAFDDGTNLTEIRFDTTLQTFLNDFWGLKIEQPYLVKLGDYNNIIKGDFLVIDNDQQQIITYMSNVEFGFFIDRVREIKFGDYNGNNNGTNLQVDDFNQEITCYSGLFLNLGCNNVNFAINGTTRQAIIGDYSANVNGTTFGVDDNNTTLIASANLLSGTSGGNSGQHLIINVGGTDYKIKLENP